MQIKKVGDILGIRKCHVGGLTKAVTTKRLGIDSKTVAKYWDGLADDLTKPRYRQRAHKIDPYKEYIRKRLQT